MNTVNAVVTPTEYSNTTQDNTVITTNAQTTQSKHCTPRKRHKTSGRIQTIPASTYARYYTTDTTQYNLHIHNNIPQHVVSSQNTGIKIENIIDYIHQVVIKYKQSLPAYVCV